jgi:hypothetical protein
MPTLLTEHSGFFVPTLPGIFFGILFNFRVAPLSTSGTSWNACPAYFSPAEVQSGAVFKT